VAQRQPRQIDHQVGEARAGAGHRRLQRQERVLHVVLAGGDTTITPVRATTSGCAARSASEE
jgi:hypothetical protein